MSTYLERACGRLRAPGASVAGSAEDAGRIDWAGPGARVTFAGRALPGFETVRDPLEAAVRGAAALFGLSFRRMRTQRALYAAGVARDGQAIALVGPSGAGKTTVLLELLRRGWQAFGDEFLLLDRDSPLARPFPLTLAVRETSPALANDARLRDACAGALATTDAAGTRTFHGLDVAEIFGPAALAVPQRLTGVVLFGGHDAVAPRLERIASAAAALRALPHFFVERVTMADVWEVARALTPLQCYRLESPDHRIAADLIEALAP